MPKKTTLIVTAMIACLSLTGCGGGSNEELLARYKPLSLEGAESLQVNGYLWQASLDTLGFMSLASTDAPGGVILTDWYVNPKAQKERTRVQVTVRDSRLRSDALAVAVTRQAMNQSNVWVNVPVQQATVAGLEDAILIRARQLRISTVTESDSDSD
jgi:hypothetical protein